MSTLIGTRTLTRFFLRRDRLALVLWVIGGVLLYVSQAVSVDGLYTTQAEFDKAAASMENNAAFIAMAGPARALNTTGGQVAWQASAFGAVLAGLMSMLLVGRHTRAEEESGRDELVRSGVVGRHAPVVAALIVAAVANLILGAAIAGTLIAYGLAAAGSVALGIGAAAAGLVFTGVALLAAQLTESTRTMYGITGVVIAVSYVLRAIGDIGNGALSWLSPIGWGQAMRAYADEVWWPVLLSLAAAGVLTWVALRVFDRRDIGSGILPQRPGPARAGVSLQSAVGMAWRLQRGAFYGWALGMFLVGLAYGSIGNDVGDLIGDSGSSSEVFAQGGGSLVDSFYATTALMMALIASCFTAQSVRRLRAEESDGHAEQLLATGLSRWRWVAGHLAITVVGSIVVVGLGGLGTGIAYGLTSGDASQILRLTGASVAHAPATWVVAAVALLLFAVVPRLTSGAWLAVGFCLVVMFFGPLLDLPGWLVDVSPFSHIPLLPVEDFTLTPILGVTLAAVLIGALGFGGFRRRDIG